MVAHIECFFVQVVTVMVHMGVQGCGGQGCERQGCEAKFDLDGVLINCPVL